LVILLRPCTDLLIIVGEVLLLLVRGQVIIVVVVVVGVLEATARDLLRISARRLRARLWLVRGRVFV
jgi:hypothetical protein